MISKRLLFIFSFATSFLIFSSCSKDKDTHVNIPDNKNPEPQTEFLVHGVADVLFENWIGPAMGITVEHVSGEQTTATIALGEMPPGVTYEIRPDSGIPTFGSIIYFKSNGASTGTHPAKVIVSSGSVSKDYGFNLQLGETRCNDPYVGYYDMLYMYCLGPMVNFVRVEKDPELANRIYLSFKENWNSEDIEFSFYADIDCNTREIIVPKQAMQLGEISGNGMINALGDPGERFIYLEELTLVDRDGNTRDCYLSFSIKQ